MVIKGNHPECRREFVNAYTAKPTAMEKIWKAVKRLLFEDDKITLSNCRRRACGIKPTLR